MAGAFTSLEFDASFDIGVAGGSFSGTEFDTSFDLGVINRVVADTGTGPTLDGLLTGTADWDADTADGSDYCVAFNDLDAMEIAGSAAEFDAYTDFSVSSLVKIDASDGGNCSLLGCSDAGGWSFGVASDYRVFFGRATTGGYVDPAINCVFGDTTLDADTWYRATVTISEAGVVKFYLNATPDGTRTGLSSWCGAWSSGADYHVAHADPNKQDDLRIYAQVLTAAEVAALPMPTVADGAIRINFGGPDYVDGLGNTWVDHDDVAELTLTGAPDPYDAGAVGISGTTDDTLYQTQLYKVGASWKATLTVPDGNYTLELHFAEVGWTSPGLRIFDVEVDGVVKVDDMDVYAEVGAFAAHIESFPVTVSGGSIDIEFVQATDSPFCCALALIPD